MVSSGSIKVCQVPDCISFGQHVGDKHNHDFMLEHAPLINDPVNHPKHYTSHPSGIECIEITRHYSFNIGNAIKYLWRQGLKEKTSDIEDLKKAVWYIQDEIAMREKNASRP